MEKLLKKIAAQLNAYDEASYLYLWEKYAAIVEDYDGSEEWEEAFLILSIIQSIRWKNQLFNHNWLAQARGGNAIEGDSPLPPSFMRQAGLEAKNGKIVKKKPKTVEAEKYRSSQPEKDQAEKTESCKVLQFKQKDKDF